MAVSLPASASEEVAPLFKIFPERFPIAGLPSRVEMEADTLGKAPVLENELGPVALDCSPFRIRGPKSGCDPVHSRYSSGIQPVGLMIAGMDRRTPRSGDVLKEMPT
jgi:hypothetical protein